MHGPLPERGKDRESRVIEYGRFLSDMELPAIPDSKPPRETRESCRKSSPDTELPAISGS